MDDLFIDFSEVIADTKRHGGMPEEAKLIFVGRVGYAMERGDITRNQKRQLLEMVEPGLWERVVEMSAIAVLGTNDEQFHSPEETKRRRELEAMGA